MGERTTEEKIIEIFKMITEHWKDAHESVLDCQVGGLPVDIMQWYKAKRFAYGEVEGIIEGFFPYIAEGSLDA